VQYIFTDEILFNFYSASTPLSPTASPVFSPTNNNNNNLSGGAIAGIVIGCVAFSVMIGALVWYFIMRDNNNYDHNRSDSRGEMNLMENPYRKSSIH